MATFDEEETKSGALEFILSPIVGPATSSLWMESLYSWFADTQEEVEAEEGTVRSPEERARILQGLPPAEVPTYWDTVEAPAEIVWDDLIPDKPDVSFGRVERPEVTFQVVDTSALENAVSGIWGGSESMSEKTARLRAATSGVGGVQETADLTKRHPGRTSLIRGKPRPRMTDAERMMQAFLDSIADMGRGGGKAPYTEIDRRTVEEAVEDQMVLLVGRIETGSVSAIVDEVMLDDRRRYEGVDVDPNMTLLAGVRGLQSYGKIHENRPDSAAEKTWVSNQRSAFLQGGGSMKHAEQRAIDLATAAGAPSTESAGVFEASRGNIVPQFMEKLNKAATFAASRVN